MLPENIIATKAFIRELRYLLTYSTNFFKLKSGRRCKKYSCFYFLFLDNIFLISQIKTGSKNIHMSNEIQIYNF